MARCDECGRYLNLRQMADVRPGGRHDAYSGVYQTCENTGRRRVQAEIDDKLLEEIRRLARDQGRSKQELLDEAVRSYLERPGSLAELFEKADRWERERGVKALSDEEACS